MKEDKKEKFSEENSEEKVSEEFTEEAQPEVEAESEAKCAETEKKETVEDEALEQKFIRLSADFQNYKRRTEKEKSDIYKFANSGLLTNLLPIIDDFERAFEHEAGSEKEAFVSGVKLVFKNLMEVLSKEGLEVIEALDKPFDPNYHHAVLSEESDEHEEDHVMLEMQKGYMYNGKVLRPSMVKVSK